MLGVQLPACSLALWGHKDSAVGSLRARVTEQSMCVSPTSSLRFTKEKLSLYLKDSSHGLKIIPFITQS